MINIRMINEGGTFELTSLKTVIDRELIIPSYQRAYAWDENNIEDLFNTIKEGFSQESEQSNTLGINNNDQPIFFGSIIFSKTDKNKYLIIDGQQRVTTFLFILRMIQEAMEKKKSNLISSLKSLDKEEQEYFDKGDKASRERVKQRIKECERKLDKYSDLITQIEKILKMTRISRESIADQDLMENEYLNYITRSKYNTSKDLAQNKNKILKQIDDLMEELSFSSWYAKYEYIVSYILNTVKFCLLSIDGENSEEYAIDVFNTLNSTGEPLTGFEVLKSTLIQMVKSSDKKQIVESKLFDLENKIKKYKPTRKDRNKQKGKLLLYTAIHRNDYDKGKLSDKKFKDQNEYIKKILKQDFLKNNELQEGRVLEVLEDIENLNHFVVSNWLPKVNKERDYSKKLKSSQSILALKGFDFLIDIGHDRVIPIIYKYSKPFLNNKFDLQSYKKIIEFCTAFSCLWRMAFHGGASGIDAEYIKIAESLASNINIDQVRINILNRFKEKFSKKTDWLEKLQQSEICKNKKLTQFLLALITLKDMSVYYSSDWKLCIQASNNGIKNRLGNASLIGKLVYNKHVKGSSTIDLQKHLRSDTYNMDVVNFYFNKSIDHRTKQFGELIWKKLAEETLGYT